MPYQTLEPGYKYNMTDMQASLGLHQLARLEHSLRCAERDLGDVRRGLRGGPRGAGTPAAEDAGSRHARHLYTLELDLDGLECDRGRFMGALAAENIGTGIHFVPVHLHQHYRETYGTRRGDLPHAERIGDRTLSLPLSAAMSDGRRRDVVAAVTKVAHRYAAHRPSTPPPGTRPRSCGRPHEPGRAARARASRRPGRRARGRHDAPPLLAGARAGGGTVPDARRAATRRWASS